MRPGRPGWWHWLTPAQRALLGACVLLALVSVWLMLPLGTESALVREAPPPLEPVPVVEPPTTVSAAGYEVLVQRNLFARSRRAPDQPWSAAADSAVPGPTRAGPAEPAAASSYRLFGTVVSRNLEDSFAIIEADAEEPGPELYNVGDRIGPYRLTSIYYTRVVLTGAGSTLELRLSPDSLPGSGLQSGRAGRPQ